MSYFEELHPEMDRYLEDTASSFFTRNFEKITKKKLFRKLHNHT